MLASVAVITRFMLACFAALAWQGAVINTEPPAVETEPAWTDSVMVTDQPASGEIETADDLLAALETAGNDVRTLSAVVSYIKTFDIQGDTQKRTGTLAFVSSPPEGASEAAASFDRRFAITFEELELDNGRRVEDASTGYLERYIFDGEWLAEVRPFDKQFVRRQVVAPGDKWDPLRLGEGPFPIPIQQRRADILERFDAKLLDGLEGVESRGVRAVAGKCYQLRLTPRAEANEKKLREVLVWYQKDTLLPRMAKTISQAGDESFVLLKDLLTNEDAVISEAELTTEPPQERDGWNITVEPYTG